MIDAAEEDWICYLGGDPKAREALEDEMTETPCGVQVFADHFDGCSVLASVPKLIFSSLGK